MHDLGNFLVDQRTRVILPGPHKVPDSTQNKHTGRDDDTIVHGGIINWCARRPDTPEDDEEHVHACIKVVNGAENTRDLPRTPDQRRLRNFILELLGGFFRMVAFGARGGARAGDGLIRVCIRGFGAQGGSRFLLSTGARAGGCIREAIEHSSVGQNVSFHPVVEKEYAWEEIGAVKSGDRQGNHIVEGGRGADVDERQGCGKSADYGDRYDGDFGAMVHLLQETGKWQALVSCKGPGHTRCGSSNAS